MVATSDPGNGQEVQNDGTNLFVRHGGALIVEADAEVHVHGREISKALADGHRIARGVHRQAAQCDTVATGLETVAAVVACWRDAPTPRQAFIAASPGDQASAPGSIVLRTFDATAAPASDFSGDRAVSWIAIGS